MNFITDKSSIQSQDYIVLVEDQKLYLSNQEQWHPLLYQDISASLLAGNICLSLGEFKNKNCYAIDVSTAIEDPTTIDENELISLRSQMHLLNEEEYLLASRSLQLITWYKQHRYCGQCGQQTIDDPVERALSCQRCKLIYYPRISPCMMCLVVRGDHCLLAHHNRHREGMYSTLAGFVEAGESLEQTIHREVQEEVGITVNNLSYIASQSWPFPHQLMVGYFAEYESGEITEDQEEIIDAQWFRYDNLPDIPPSATLSGILINEFVRRQKG